jgi:hypothetical protein
MAKPEPVSRFRARSNKCLNSTASTRQHIQFSLVTLITRRVYPPSRGDSGGSAFPAPLGPSKPPADLEGQSLRDNACPPVKRFLVMVITSLRQRPR